MNQYYIATAIFLLILAFFYYSNKENFSAEMNARKKARAGFIFDRFKDEVVPSYPAFKKILPDGDAVEYYDISRLKTGRAFTRENIEQSLGVVDL